MAAATRNHAAEFLPGICAAESITAEDRERLSGMPMTSTGAERLYFASERAQDIRAGASRDDTRAGVILGHADCTAAWMRERANVEEEWKLLRKRARQGLK
eukprot:3175098-Pleurochrysis_carterae.AAC.1